MARAEARYTLTAEDKTAAAFQSVKGRLSTAGKAFAKFGAGATVAAGAGFAAMAKQAIDNADEIGKLARQLGVSTQLLSEMQGVLQLTGGNFDQFTKGIGRMQKVIVDADNGLTTATRALDALGLTSQELLAAGPEQAFNMIAGGLSELEDPTLRAATAQDIFGRGYKTVLRLIGQGIPEIERLRAEQAAMGNTLNEETTVAAERFNDAIARMRQQFQGAVLGTVAENIDDLASSMEHIVTLIPAIIKGFSFIAQTVTGIGEFLGASAAVIGNVLTGNFAEAANVVQVAARDVASSVNDAFGIQPSATSAPGALQEQRGRETLEVLKRIATNTEESELVLGP